MYQWQKLHIINELEDNGHTIKSFNPFLYENFRVANTELITYIKKNRDQIHLFINTLGSDVLFIETVEDITKMGIKSLLLCYDNLHAPFMHKKLAPYFNLVWLTSKETLKIFSDWNTNVIYLPYAANPKVFKPNYSDEIFGIGFIGTPYGTRIQKINKLLENNINCLIYSDEILQEKNSNFTKNHHGIDALRSFYNLARFSIGRQVILGAIKKNLFSQKQTTLLNSIYLKQFPSVPFDNLSYLYSNFAISLGITELRNTYVLTHPVHKLHLRTFEIPMCGGLQFSSYTDDLAEYFEDEKEIILYKSEEEMISKAKFYLRQDNLKIRNKMKANARFRAENEHTWNKRFEVVFNLLFN
jgi:Uncharacterized protein conserved in bacteria